jgi:hypothetical protein
MTDLREHVAAALFEYNTELEWEHCSDRQSWLEYADEAIRSVREGDQKNG